MRPPPGGVSWHRGLRAEEDRPQIDIDVALPVLLGGLVKALRGVDRRHVDEHVDAAQAGHYLIHQYLTVPGAAHVRGDGRGAAPKGPYFRHGGVGLVFRPAKGDGDIRAPRGQLARHHLANPLAACDEYHPVLECHAPSDEGGGPRFHL
jgi:hypothetical protein